MGGSIRVPIDSYRPNLWSLLDDSLLPRKFFQFLCFSAIGKQVLGHVLKALK